MNLVYESGSSTILHSNENSPEQGLLRNQYHVQSAFKLRRATLSGYRQSTS